MRPLVPCIMAGILLVNSAAGAQDLGMRHYVNARFGFSADIPAGFVASEPPANGDGLAFHTPDGVVELTASAIGNAAETSLAEFMAYSNSDCVGGKPSYLAPHQAWAVLSCAMPQNRILYEKTIMRGRGEGAVFTTIRMTYPADQHARWDHVAVAATRSITPAPSR